MAVNLIHHEGMIVKRDAHERFASTLAKRKKFRSDVEFFIRVYTTWKMRLIDRVKDSIEKCTLPRILSDLLWVKCFNMIEVAFKWIRTKWQKHPDLPDINLYTFQFDLLCYNLDETLNEKESYINHLSFFEANKEDVTNIIKTRYRDSYSQNYKLVVLFFQIQIFELQYHKPQPSSFS
ncbi:hypothetical protein WDU94_009418 [Cyamophila willieti]